MRHPAASKNGARPAHRPPGLLSCVDLQSPMRRWDEATRKTIFVGRVLTRRERSTELKVAAANGTLELATEHGEAIGSHSVVGKAFAPHDPDAPEASYAPRFR